MTRGALAVSGFLVMLAIAGRMHAQSAPAGVDHFQAGRDALAAHDPTRAITHFEQVDTKEAAEWLAVALMMESRSPSDQFVERAFAAAVRARAEQASQVPPRATIAAALRRGDMIIAFLVGESYTYAWAFDRDGFVGYQLSAAADITPAVERARTYADRGDRDGLQRIAEDLVPTILGPVAHRLSELKRLVIVLDGPLRGLPIGALPVGDARIPLEQRVEVSPAEFGSLMGVIALEPKGPIVSDAGVPPYVWLVAGTLLAFALVGGIRMLKRR